MNHYDRVFTCNQSIKNSKEYIISNWKETLSTGNLNTANIKAIINSLDQQLKDLINKHNLLSIYNPLTKIFLSRVG